MSFLFSRPFDGRMRRGDPPTGRKAPGNASKQQFYATIQPQQRSSRQGVCLCIYRTPHMDAVYALLLLDRRVFCRGTGKQKVVLHAVSQQHLKSSIPDGLSL
jgi:hypothetical protein